MKYTKNKKIDREVSKSEKNPNIWEFDWDVKELKKKINIYCYYNKKQYFGMYINEIK